MKKFSLKFAICLSVWFYLGAAISGYCQNRREADFAITTPSVLIGRWEKSDYRSRMLIQNALIENRATSVRALREALLTGTSNEKLFAASMLAWMRDQEAVDVLIAATSDSNPNVQARVITAIGTIRAYQAIGRLREIVRTAKDRLVLKAAVAALGKIGSARDLPVLRPLLSIYGDEDLRIVAAGVLAMLGSFEGERILLDGSTSDDFVIQKHAIYLLGFVNTQTAKQRLTQILVDPTGRWKSYAVMAQAQLELEGMSRREQTTHLSSLVRMKDPLVSDWAMEQIVDSDDPDKANILMRAVENGGKNGEQIRRRLRAIGSQ